MIAPLAAPALVGLAHRALRTRRAAPSPTSAAPSPTSAEA